ncbi:MAG: chemotaxis-specific protein-glutamate methyltransferase CheB, partial [Pseudomonadota bacterium]
IRVLIVDDSLTVRTIFKRMVESDGAMSVVETASSAERAIAQLEKTRVDVVLLDLEMPGMGGLEALPTILEHARGGQVLVVSSLTQDGAEATISALSMGAADTMLKPRPGGFNEDYRSQLLGKIRALGENQPGGEPGEELNAAQHSDKNTDTDKEPLAAKSQTAQPRQASRPSTPSAPALRPAPTKPPEVIAIGASTGGIHALNILLRCLTPDFDLPILVTQHLPASFIPVFARQVEMACARPAVIAAEGTEIRRGQVTIATGHGHMVVRRAGDRLIAKTSNEPARSGCLPSVDPMFESLAEACNGRVLGIVLSGMGRDGLHGAQKLVDAGGTILAQNAETSAVWGMPGAVTKAGLSSLVASPEELGARVLDLGLSVTTHEPG